MLRGRGRVGRAHRVLCHCWCEAGGRGDGLRFEFLPFFRAEARAPTFLDAVFEHLWFNKLVSLLRVGWLAEWTVD